MDVDTTHDGGPRLAQELLDLTLDYLHYDLESLKQSALASKSLLPTCQRHLFSTFQIAESNDEKLVKLFTPPRTGDDDEDASRVTHLLDTYTTHLILTGHRAGLASRINKQGDRLPEFKSVQKITFKGEELHSAVTIPSFLVQAWTSPSSGLRSVEFDFSSTSEKGVLESLYLLPAAVESVSFTCADSYYDPPTTASIRKGIKRRSPSAVDYRPGVHHIGGTLKLRLDPTPHLFPVMVELKDMFRFGLERISCRLASREAIGGLALLVDECKDTLQFLDISITSPETYREHGRSFDFSHHRALRNIRIWTPGTFEPKWLCTAISTIPAPSSTTPRVPPLRIELHISLPHWMMYPSTRSRDMSREVEEIVTPWIAVESQLSQLIGLDPDIPSATPGTDGKTTGILLDITVPELTTGPGKGAAALMFPRLSSIKGLVRLV